MQILKGAEVTGLSASEKYNLAQKIHNNLKKCVGLMKQYDIQSILEFINLEHFVVILDGGNLLAHGKFIIHPKLDDFSEDIYEIGSVFVDENARGQGLSRIVIESVSSLIAAKFPDRKQILVTAFENKSMQASVEKFPGIKRIDFPSNVPHLIPGVKTTYEISQSNIS